MANLTIENEDFGSTKSGMMIIAFLVSLLLLAAVFFIGVLAILFTIALMTLKVGIEIDQEKERYRFFKSFFGYPSGKWMSLEKYKVLVVLKKNLKSQVLSPKLVSALNYKQVVFEVNLTTESHRAKIRLKRFRSADAAMKFAKKLNVDLGFPLENYNPVISDKTKQRRERRR